MPSPSRASSSSSTALAPGALVLYRGRPARVEQARGKILLRLPGGEERRVRAKDVQVLHPGPVDCLDRLTQVAPADLQEAWEILQGEPPLTLADLSEFVLGIYTPETAWAGWQGALQSGYFEGTPEALQARSPEAWQKWKAREEEKARRERQWADFLRRAREDRVDPGRDRAFLQDVIALALERSPRSRVLQALGMKQTPEQAHEVLLRWRVWTPRYNPYPRRLGLPLKAPDLPFPPLPQEDREDLTHLPAFAIDDEGSQDPDDALSWDGERLWVHVADVAACVPPDSPLDLEARQRGSSIYLPEGVVPMLPEAARERLALGLQDPSPALSIGIRLSEDGSIEEVSIVPSWVRVTRWSYEEAETRMEAEATLRVLERLLQAFARRRREAGAVDLALPEVKVVVEEDGRIALKPLARLRSRNLVQEAMLLAGAAVAQWAEARGIPLPYTVQAPPREPPEPLPPGLAGMYALRRTLSPSEYKAHPEPHHGMGLRAYVQATSPLRRYLDLVVHQQIRAHLQGKPLLDEEALLERVGMAEAARRTVRLAERLSRRHWIGVYLLEQEPHWQGEGVVVKTERGRVTVLVPALAVEEQVTPPYPVEWNQVLRLEVRGVDLPRRRIHFSVLGAAQTNGQTFC